ncbi:MAG TPA: YraN family protein [Methylophaga aminisulfidivorans]|uniref:UPF0102 protein ENI26_12275 n=2 Tax=root TaxID=1 RepID=A0A7C1VQH0_9GAMM|nr:YraN family protein [Methylophaga aminisulfidivorans]
MLFARDKGLEIERRVCRHLEKHGLRLVERNYLCKGGEIDLIMRDNKTLVFIEVRFRKTVTYGSALESVDKKKQNKIIHAAQHFLQSTASSNVACRFDVVAVSPDNSSLKIDWVQDAFQLN